MLNLKLLTIASLIAKDDIVIDTCCDHAYLAIYLKENKLCKDVFASDINKNALNIAENNIRKSKLKIKAYLSDGLKSVPENNINTVVIAGVGTKVALDIVANAKTNIIKYIISSNNNHFELRNFMYKKGYYLEKEIVVKENNKFYPVMLFTKEKKKVTKNILKYGLSNNKEYYNYLLNKEKTIFSKIPKKHLITRFNHKRNINYLKNLI